MPSYKVNPTDLPTTEDERFWAEEAEFFRFKAGNPRAPQDSSDYAGWGIPPEKLPPPDAIAYVIAHYRENELGLRNHDKEHSSYTPLHPMFKWSFLCACMAHFLWFRTAAGAKWVMRLYGVEEVVPFYEGYAYFWVDPKTGTPALLSRPVYQQDPNNPTKKRLVDGVELRIFREWERNLDPPCSAQIRGPLEDMKKLMTKYRSPYASREPSIPDDKVFFWVSEILRDWFLESQPNRDWPTRKPARVCGWQWVKNLERSPQVRFFEAMEKVSLFRHRAYRLKDVNGGVYWCGGKEFKIIPLKELYLEQRTMSEPEVDAIFRCKNCRKRKACVPSTGDQHRCCHCFSVEIERDDRPMLNKCTMNRECKACPDVINTHNDLVELKNRLNRPARTGPVPR
jgi:hypothetical protein